MKHLILGTAGHVDHGKTALVKALTGVNTDRLAEEKKRGITIVLGFAELTLPGGIQIGIVDVPGHERFVNNMLSGIGGIDMVMLVVAADEGVMPQTREHFAICRLLEVSKGLIVITKKDLVDSEWLELVVQDVEDLVAGSFLEGSGIYPVSSLTGEGLPELTEGLSALAGEVPDRESDGIFRLPVDRVFTIKGFGTVVTGTLVSGKVNAGEQVEVLPGGLKARVRGVQVHSLNVNEALSGQRTALNLQGVEKERIDRGDTLAAPGLLTPTFMVDASILLLPDEEKPLKKREAVRFYLGAMRCVGHVVLLDGGQLMPGENGYAQIRLTEPIVAIGGDRFILRSISANRTIGGGHILDPLPMKHKSTAKGLIPALEILEKGDAAQKAEVFLKHAGFRGMDLSGFRCRLPLGEAVARGILQKLREKGTAVTVIKETLHLLHIDYDTMLKERLISTLADFHRSKPLEPGMSKAELLSRFAGIVEEKVFLTILARLGREEKLHMEEKWVWLADHKVKLTGEEEKAAGQIETIYRDAGLQPPYARSVTEELGLNGAMAADLFKHLVESKRLVRITGDLYINPGALEKAREMVRACLESKGEASIGEVKEHLNMTRKFLIPMLEYFDAIGFTARKGDKRVLR
ncbi:MAG: selenocysteine-specific translation elongation factor [bacterium]|nr:selenocysteine-specific translation elongation factor [bacterium]